ncbi:MAG TPA: carboxypeptidase regulatory-like domain-containing protein [Terriglobales bacterium]|nr:carboxypeptidase regulatory-like domain-containing protein [Terriglobales bacterium]
MRRRSSIWLEAIIFGAILSQAQITTTKLLGTVVDPNGAYIAGAEITLTNTDTNMVRQIRSAADGAYRAEFLPVGNYKLDVRAAGFRDYVRKDIILALNENVRVDVKMEVGRGSDSVVVTEAPPLVDTSSASLGRTVRAFEIANLPLVDRNPYRLLDLTPGVQSNNAGLATASSATSNIVLGFPEQRTLINGGVDGGVGSVSYYLDGGINMTGLRNTGNVLPNPEAIQEFRVQTNNYGVEYGRFAGGVIDVVTKSGTNSFHGSAFEFVRNAVFNANDWGSTLPKAPFHGHQFGATFGGPIRKDSTFFFFSYSGLRQTTSTFLNSAVVPTPLERTGDFSQSAHKPIDPATGKVFTCDGVVGKICSNRLDPVAMNILNTLVPSATPGVAGNVWQGYVPSPYNSDEFLIKVDHQINTAHRFTGSYFETGGSNTIQAGGGNLPWGVQELSWRQHEVNLSDVWVISGDQVNQAWLTYTRNFGGRLNLPPTSLGDLGSTFTVQGVPSLPQITVQGYFNLTNAIAGPTAGTNFYSLRDVFLWSRGRHTIKFGAELSLNKDIQQTLLNNYGVFTFNGGVTKASNALADFELGIPSAVSQDSPITGYTNSWYIALFAQDDFRVHPRVTLNLGLRWDVQTPPTDPLDREATYLAGEQSTVRPSAPTGILFPGDAGVERGIVPIRWHHVSPRVGVAWDPFGDGRTAVRAGAGVYFGSVSGNEWNTTTNFEPFSIRLSFANVNQKTSPSGAPLGATLSNPYNAYPGGNPFPYQGTFVAGGSIFGASTNFQWPYTYQLNFSVARQLTNSLAVTAAYVGSLSHDLPFAQDVNYPVVTANATTSSANVLARRPNPAFGQILLLQSNQTASYHALQLEASKRMGNHFGLSAFYVYSKTLNSVELQNNTTQGGAQNMSNLSEDRGRADTDQRHVFGASFVFQPNYYNGSSGLARGILNGWSISSIIRWRSGVPFTVLNGIDANLDGVSNTDRAQLIGDPHVSHPTAARWFNTDAFVQNQAVTGVATDGNSPRNFLDNPGYQDIDLAILRDFKLTERFGLTFRAEATNAFNMVSLVGQRTGATGFGQTVGTALFGQLRNAQPMRRLQFGLRLVF